MSWTDRVSTFSPQQHRSIAHIISLTGRVIVRPDAKHASESSPPPSRLFSCKVVRIQWFDCPVRSVEERPMTTGYSSQIWLQLWSLSAEMELEIEQFGISVVTVHQNQPRCYALRLDDQEIKWTQRETRKIYIQFKSSIYGMVWDMYMDLYLSVSRLMR